MNGGSGAGSNGAEGGSGGAPAEPAGTRGGITAGIGMTALGVASARAIETHRDDRMINDPFAEAFVRAADLPSPMPTTPAELARLTPANGWVLNWRYMGVRTRYFDDFFAEAWSAGLRQSVILASGLDARPFRLAWPTGSVVYEVDRPEVLEFKRGVLDEQGASARCEHRMVALDLRDDWVGALRAAGFDDGAATVWLVEGLLPYLPPEAEVQLFAAIDSLSATGSRMGIEDAKKIAQTLPDQNYTWATQQWGTDLRTLVHEDEPRDAAATLRTLGWSVAAEPIDRTADRYGHPLDRALATTIDASRFLTAHRTH